MIKQLQIFAVCNDKLQCAFVTSQNSVCKLYSVNLHTRLVTVRLIVSLQVPSSSCEMSPELTKKEDVCVLCRLEILKELNHQSARSVTFLNCVSSLCFKHFIWIFKTKLGVSMASYHLLFELFTFSPHISGNRDLTKRWLSCLSVYVSVARVFLFCVW